MDRRLFIGTLAGSLLAAPLAAEAQSTGKIARIGYLTTAQASEPSVDMAFRQGLPDLGYVREPERRDRTPICPRESDLRLHLKKNDTPMTPELDSKPRLQAAQW
jgi:hypothetical protein